MKEIHLQHIWHYKLFDFNHLVGTKNEAISILNYGILNTDSGPSFKNVQIKINSIIWAGNLEIHINSSDWYKHETDRAYVNVVLHVVWNHDRIVLDENNQEIPTLVLKNFVSVATLNQLKLLSESKLKLPCQPFWKSISIDEFKKNLFLEILFTNRIHEKIKEIQQQNKLNPFHWEQKLFRRIAYTLGLKVNSEAFLQWSSSFDFKLVLQYTNEPLLLQALFFGQAHFLNKNSIEDSYYKELQAKYKHIQIKHHLIPIHPSLFKWFRLRPISFPTLKIAQLAAIYQNGRLFQSLKENPTLKNLNDLFIRSLHPYWENHYKFGKWSATKNKKMSLAAVEKQYINTIIPIFYEYNLKTNGNLDSELTDELHLLKTEKNNILDNFKKSPFTSKNAFESQAILQLHKEYCIQKKCLQCKYGYEILKK